MISSIRNLSRLLLALVLAFVLVGKVSAQSTITVSGRVTNSLGQGIASQSVYLAPSNCCSNIGVMTDSSGHYSVNLSPGSYYLLMQAFGGIVEGAPRIYDIRADSPINLSQNTTLDISLPTQRVEVHVQDLNGNPVASAAVQSSFVPSLSVVLGTSLGPLSTSGNITPYDATTDSSGNAVLWLFNSTYNLAAWIQNGGQTVSASVNDVVVGTDISQTIILPIAQTAPVTTVSLSPSPNLAGYYPDPVTVSFSVTSSGGNPLTSYQLDGGSTQTYTMPFAVAGLGSHTITYWSTDGGLSETPKVASFTINQPLITNIAVTNNPATSGSVVGATASFTDADSLSTHTALWSWGDGSTSSGVISEANGSGTVSGSHTYPTAGVYTLGITVTENGGFSGSMIYRYIAVYDPSAGYLAGSGSYDSLAGWDAQNPQASGKVQFGISAKYTSQGAVPTGNTKLNFKVGDLDFRSTSYDWLVVSEAKATLRGTGTVNGTGSYTLLLSSVDGSQTGGGDLIRVKITDSTNSVVYDTQMGAADTADPTTALEHGSIKVR